MGIRDLRRLSRGYEVEVRSWFDVFHTVQMVPILAALGACGGITALPGDAGPSKDDGDASAGVGGTECTAPTLSGVPAPTVKRFDMEFPVPTSPGGLIASGTYVLTEVDEYGQASDTHMMPVAMVIDASAGTISQTWQAPDGGTQSLVGTYTTSNSHLSSIESPSCGPTYSVGEPYSASGTRILLYVFQNGNGIVWTYARQ
jgi:hypothetical protein